MHHVPNTVDETAGSRDDLGPLADMPEVHQARARIEEGIQEGWAVGYAAGRADACQAAIIHIALHGFHPHDREWVERFKQAITGRRP